MVADGALSESGCENGVAQPGDDGAPGSTPALGGDKDNKGSDGGDGGAGSSPDGVSSTVAERGGGGGGGGAGYVILYGPTAPTISAGAVVSPGAIIK